MRKFTFLFELVLAEKLLQHSDNLSKTLQAPSLTASEGQEIADLTCKTLSQIRSTEAFNLLWERLQLCRENMELKKFAFLERGKLFGVWKLVLKNPTTTQAHHWNSIPDNTSSVLISSSARSRIDLSNPGTECSKS